MSAIEMLNLVVRLEKLKETVRTGWNMEFPDGHRFKTRRVNGAESTADHSWGVAMFALIVAHTFGLDILKMVWMALIHDVAEIITLDIVTATLEPDEKALAIEEKKRLEDAAMRSIFFPLGEWGLRCYELWIEYEHQSSPEARALKQVDKLETCIQALIYKEQGHQVDPNEFFDCADEFLTDPRFVEMMKLIRERASA